VVNLLTRRRNMAFLLTSNLLDLARRYAYFAAILLALLVPTKTAAKPATLQEPKCKDTPLLAAIHDRDEVVALRFIGEGAELDAKPCGATALGEAIVLDEMQVIEELLRKRADPNVGDSRNTPPLMDAAFYCREKVVPLLLTRGAKIDAVDFDGYSALMWSTQNCRDGAMASVLLRYGAKVNLRTKDGTTALIAAAFFGNEDAVHVLVSAGAELNSKTDEGTALTIARDREVGRRSSHDRIYNFLLEVSRLDSGLHNPNKK